MSTVRIDHNPGSSSNADSDPDFALVLKKACLPAEDLTERGRSFFAFVAVSSERVRYGRLDRTGRARAGALFRGSGTSTRSRYRQRHARVAAAPRLNGMKENVR